MQFYFNVIYQHFKLFRYILDLDLCSFFVISISFTFLSVLSKVQ